MSIGYSGARFDGHLVWWEHGGQWIVGAEDCPNGEPGGTEPDPSELMATRRHLRVVRYPTPATGQHASPATVRQVVA